MEAYAGLDLLDVSSNKQNVDRAKTELSYTDEYVDDNSANKLNNVEVKQPRKTWWKLSACQQRYVTLPMWRLFVSESP